MTVRSNRRAAARVCAAVAGVLSIAGLSLAAAAPSAAAPATAASLIAAGASPTSAQSQARAEVPFPPELLAMMAANTKEDDTSAVQEFGACLNGGGEADLLLLVDESSSLATTDPGAARADSASYFVGELADYVSEGGQPVDLQLDVFAHSAETLMPWSALDDSSLSGIQDSIATLADRVDGFDTDYWTALDASQRAMNAKAAESADGPPRCQAIVMFSDGQLDYFPRTTPEEQQQYGTEKPFAPGVQLTTQEAADEVREAARNDICRDGGLADQLTSSGIKIFGIGLSVDPETASEFELFQAIVEGSGEDGTTCGSLGDGSRGDFFLAGDIDDLLFAFDSIVDDPIQVDGGICQEAPCASEAHEFVLDTSTPDVGILAQADVPNLQVTIQLPNGELVEFPMTDLGTPSTLDVGGIEFAYTWQTDRTISIDAAQAQANSDTWMGLWQLAFTDPSGQSAGQQSRSNIHISGSLRPSVEGQDALEFHAGGSADMQLGIDDRRTGPIDPATIPGEMRFSATLVDAAGTSFDVLSTDNPAGLAGPASVDLSDAAVGAAQLRLVLNITTAPAQRQDGTPVPGTQLAPAAVNVPVNILTPASYPVLGQSIDFGSASGDVDLTASLPVSGEGCAWVDPAETPTMAAAPDGIGSVSVTADDHASADACLQAGGDGLELTLRTDEPGNGTINGTVPIMLGSADGAGEPIRVDVPFTANLERPLNTLNFLLVLIAAPILGIGLPLLLLYLAKWVISKIPSRPLVATTIDVTVQHGQVMRGGGRFELGPRDLVNTVAIPPGGGRSLRVGDVTLKARTGASPTGAGFVTVDAPGRASAGSTMPSTDRSGVRARLPLAVHNTWVVLHPDGAPGDTAQVLVLVGGDATAGARDDLQNDINRRLPDLLDKLVRERGGSVSGGGGHELAAAGSPFGGGPTPQHQGSPFQAGGQGAAPFGGGGQGTPPGGGRGPSPFQGGGQSPWGAQ
ncbi:hypothetical protein GCM10011490_01570 [Pseudoclavibacter endophyticus]|uniref:VWA domain-containing protein n=1 Tax=Pseudoclavibacter endophyticus TaxID=1778590 RepID=A0A6H9WUD8_9MICO|nr:vWA domain-containing protein [Pseudoclavibacter endophyticus]KAB1650295.1 VWA domain-containing protein [Pseudoclavibacter endophyticus]GGA55386.1 hypothetical protein GCM10011490_01570 [Pseudoclavibacter endophyticus]